MRFYETMFILNPTLTQEGINGKIEFFKNILLNNHATIEGCIDIAMRNLAYEIKKSKRGYYYVIYFKAQPSLVAELERNYRISEDVLRFIVINYKNKKEQAQWQVLVDRANGKIEAPKPKDKVKTSPDSAQSDSTSESSEENQLSEFGESEDSDKSSESGEIDESRTDKDA